MRSRYTLMFFCFMLAAGCAVVGVGEYRLSSRSSQEPEEVSLRDLIKRGPDGNPNIILTDFSIFEDYVYQKKLLSGRWTKVWVPIVPSDADEPVPGKPPAIRAFLFSQNIGNDKEVRERFDRPRLHCMVNPEAPKPGIVGSVLIERQYPGTDPQKCIILEEGKKPAGVLKLALFALGSLFFLALTGGIWYLSRVLDKVDTPEAKSAEKSKFGRQVMPESEAVLDALPADDAEGRAQF